MAKKTVDALGAAELRGKRALVRVDFNVPLDESAQITDDTRIRAALPTIRQLIDGGARVILVSHLGRPKGFDDQLRLSPVAKRLGELLSKPVAKVDDVIGPEVEEAVKKLQDGDVLLLENVRFYPEEEKNNPEFAQKLASLADLYVNDAFGTAHRAHASTEGVARYLRPAVAGLLLQKELEYLGKALESPERPVLAIMGGAKVSDKIQLIQNMLTKVDSIVIGGAMAYTFLKAQGIATGASRCETSTTKKDGTTIDLLKLALDLLAEAKERGVTFLLPVDHRTNDKFADSDTPNVTPDANIPEGQMALDIGPKTEALYVAEVKKARTVIWNGPMGVFELPGFSHGTFAVAQALAESDNLSIVGGGDSASAAEKAGIVDQLSHVSTGGGASLEFLEGKILPGVAALDEA
ncbi:phosphoglycerate kinase [Gloeobacter kilaueensis]|uniref:Phosphoglycerate kinase n=1 Tax=Gloeobacter kilaueensis (strain ATCC BAA-2537 / CCAP 1431/1 / ULC 316 / JS1) TaxID=1183438 RepID=U5QLP0_GLOK1|nr:phosphoglycerate kinase [Gloeobacter kilaueensis]AGY59816.1 phosphoglycerate kinase [Gloeobacter kilaueensis JS1]